jgi:hypothetical protein
MYCIKITNSIEEDSAWTLSTYINIDKWFKEDAASVPFVHVHKDNVYVEVI